MSEVEFVFGGSFDPIHFGHLHIIDSLQALNSAWPIRVLPCSTPALKKPTSASFVQRVAMIRLALTHYQNIIIDQREGARKGKSYSCDTLRELRREYSARRFLLVIGSDNLQSIAKWYQPEQLAKLCHLIVVNRPDSNVEEQYHQLEKIGFERTYNHSQFDTEPSGLFYYYKIIEKDTSSTAIRESLSRGAVTNEMGQNYLEKCKTVRKSSTKDLLEYPQDIVLTTPEKKNKSRMIEDLEIETPEVVKDYIKRNSIYR